MIGGVQTTIKIMTDAFVYHWLVKQCWNNGSNANGVIEKAKAEVEMKVHERYNQGTRRREEYRHKKRRIYLLAAARRLS